MQTALTRPGRAYYPDGIIRRVWAGIPDTEVPVMTAAKLAEILSQHEEFSGYEIGEDNEGQLIIYTGLYADPDNSDTWHKVTINPVPTHARPE